jgi:hypothetical protein
VHSRTPWLTLLVVAGAGTFLISGPAIAAAMRSAVINLPGPTLIVDTFVQGSVLVEHDEARMARGEPCTAIYRFTPGKGRGEELVSFHCKPRRNAGPDRFALATTRDSVGTRVLLEYQFAGDEEAHGVPTSR